MFHDWKQEFREVLQTVKVVSKLNKSGAIVQFDTERFFAANQYLQSGIFGMC